MMQKFTPAAWAWIQAAWLNPLRPSVRQVYIRALQIGAMMGWQIPNLSTVRRRLHSIPWEEALQARWPERLVCPGAKTARRKRGGAKRKTDNDEYLR